MPRLLVVHHTPSPAVHAMVTAALDGARHPELARAGVEVVAHPALGATAVDVLEADGYVLVAPANLGDMAGALKHFFDTVYYPCLDSTVGRPVGVAVHGNDDTTGALRSIARITTGLRWREVIGPVCVTGAPTAADLDRCRDLGGTVAARLTE